MDAFALVVWMARLYRSSELMGDEPIDAAEVLDALIVESRKLTGEKPPGVE